MATPTLKYVAPTTPEAELTFAPEPVVIYGVPSGGGGGGAVDSVNGKTGTVVITAPDITSGTFATARIPALPISKVTDLQTALDAGQSEIDALSDVVATKASTSDMTAALSGKASTTDLDNVFTIATNAVPQTRTVAGKPLSANVALDKVDVGLASVDNTSDANKPVSTAQQTALNGKVNAFNGVTGLWLGTQAQYNALTPVATVVYVIQG